MDEISKKQFVKLANKIESMLPFKRGDTVYILHRQGSIHYEEPIVLECEVQEIRLGKFGFWFTYKIIDERQVTHFENTFFEDNIGETAFSSYEEANTVAESIRSKLARP